MSVLWKPDGTLIEQARSLARGDKLSLTQSLVGQHSVCVNSMPWPGALGKDEFAAWRVVNASVAPVAGDAGRLTIQWERATSPEGFTVPRTQLRGSPKTFPVYIIRHPKYAALRTWNFCRQLMIFEDSGDDAKRVAARTQMISIGNGIATGLGTDFVAKRCDAGIETCDVGGIVYEVESHSWAFPALTLGGYYGSSGPTLPDSGSWPTGSEFKRLGDSWTWNGSYYTLTAVWEIGPTGIFSSDPA